MLTVLCSALALGALGGCPSYPLPVDLDPALLRDALRGVDAFLRNVTAGVPGVVATVVYRNATVFFGGYGRRDHFDPTSGPPTADDLVRIASITKTFTSGLLLALRDAGAVGADDALTGLMPAFRVGQPYATRRPLTLRQLGSHTAGLPRETPYPCEFNATCTEAQILGLLAEQYLVLGQYERFHYSNLGFSLLGRALGHAVGRPYEALVAEQLLGPAGMAGATFAVDNATVARMAVGVDGTQRARVRDLGWDNPCGGLIASSADMARYMSAVLEGTLLDPSTVNEFLAPVTMLRDGTEAVGLPWEMAYRGGHWYKSKQGGLAGYRSSLALLPELRLGVFITALQNDVDDDYVWAFTVLDMLAPAVTALLWERQPPPRALLPVNASRYAGQYDQDVRVYLSDAGDTLLANAQGTLFNLTAFAPHGGPPVPHVVRVARVASTSSCRWLDDSADQELAYFEAPADGGPATALVLLDSRYVRTGP